MRRRSARSVFRSIRHEDVHSTTIVGLAELLTSTLSPSPLLSGEYQFPLYSPSIPALVMRMRMIGKFGRVKSARRMS